MSVLPFHFKGSPSAGNRSGLDHRRGLRPRQLVVGLSALCLGVLSFAGPAGASRNPTADNPAASNRAGSNPAGNNGTIKIDGVAFDDHPNNEPHPGCVFEVDFYGFDEGDLNATVTFAVQPPTGHGDELVVEDDVVFIGEDDNSGGGSEAGLDASQDYDLTDALAAYSPHPRQGYHVKLTVHADGSQGADTKHKVFWIEECDAPVDTKDDSDDVDDTTDTTDDTDDTTDRTDTTDSTDSTDDTTDTTDAANETDTRDDTDSDVDVLGGAISDETPNPAGTDVRAAGLAAPNETAGKVPTTVLGATLVRPEASAAPAALARTGSSVQPALFLAGILLALGALARRIGRLQAATTRG